MSIWLYGSLADFHGPPQFNYMFSSLKTTRDILKFRLRMWRALREPAPALAASPQELDRLVSLQTAYWQAHPPLLGQAAQEFLHDLNRHSISTYVLSVRGREVRLWDKGDVSYAGVDEVTRRHEQRSFLKRAQMYRAFVQTVLARGSLNESFDLALNVTDIPDDATELPIFGFQKLRGGHHLLLPDVDFFHSKWYLDERDAVSYEEKSISACFVGSSTGGLLSEDGIRNGETPRLRAAAYYHGHPQILFRIANAVHCVSDEARALLESQPYFGGQMGWQDQLGHRFLMSMDGNGAACSRLVKGLLSNSVVVKFDSPYDLYYFPALRLGGDMLLAKSEADVERFVEAELECPGTFKDVAESGQRFVQKYLTIHSVMDYTERLLESYASLVRC